METTRKAGIVFYSPPDKSFEGPDLNGYYGYTATLKLAGEELYKETKANSAIKFIKGENPNVENIAKSSFAIPVDQRNFHAK